MNQTTIQNYNTRANTLTEELKTFFSLESNGLGGIKVSSRIINVHVVPTIDFKENKHASKLINRLKEFNFPVPTIDGTIALFKDINNARQLSSPNNPGHKLEDGDVQEVFQKIFTWMKEKGHQGRLLQGTNFVRLQSKDLAAAALGFLKVAFAKDFRFNRIHEDIFFSPKSTRKIMKTDVAHTGGEESSKEFLTRVITEVFGLNILLSEEDNGNIIFGFEDEKSLQDAKDFADLCELSCTLVGQTIVFPSGAQFPEFETIKQHFDSGSSPASSPVANSEKLPTISSDEFYEQVRRYVKDIGYQKATDSSQRRNGPYSYVFGFKKDQDIDALLTKAATEKPEWEVKRVSNGSSWIDFALKNAPQPELKNDPINTSDLSLPKKVLAKLEEVYAKTFDNAKILGKHEAAEAITLIGAIGAKLGLKYERVLTSASQKENYPNGRYFHWNNKVDKIKEAIPFFVQLGYEVHLSRTSLFFAHVYPQRPGTEKVATPRVVPQPQPKPQQQQNATIIKRGETLKLNFEVDVPIEKIMEALTSIPDEKLLQEIKRRGKGFSKQVLSSIVEQMD